MLTNTYCCVYTVLDFWWWTENLSETCRVLFQKQIWEISASRWFYYKNFCYLFGCILNPEDYFYHKYIRTVLWKATFKVVYHTQYSFYQCCFRVGILGIVLINEVLLGRRICLSNCVTFYEMEYLLQCRMSCSLLRIGIWLCSQSVCLPLFACDWYYLWTVICNTSIYKLHCISQTQRTLLLY